MAHCETAHSLRFWPVSDDIKLVKHLPLATDLIVAEAAVDAVVDQRGDELDLWVLPSLAYGMT